MIWLIDSNRAGPGKPDSDSVWQERASTVVAHKSNLTHISPCIYGFDAGGRLAMQKAQAGTAKHLPLFAATGLDIVPLIGADGGVGGLAALIRDPEPFIDAAISAALKNNYSGYNVGYVRFRPSALSPGSTLQKSYLACCSPPAVTRHYSDPNCTWIFHSQFDNELRGRQDSRSWAFLKPYAAPWIAFLNKFAAALHAHGKTLSVDIAGCCGWVDR
jgi:hypothetical protein